MTIFAPNEREQRAWRHYRCACQNIANIGSTLEQAKHEETAWLRLQAQLMEIHADAVTTEPEVSDGQRAA